MGKAQLIYVTHFAKTCLYGQKQLLRLKVGNNFILYKYLKPIFSSSSIIAYHSKKFESV